MRRRDFLAALVAGTVAAAIGGMAGQLEEARRPAPSGWSRTPVLGEGAISFGWDPARPDAVSVMRKNKDGTWEIVE